MLLRLKNEPEPEIEHDDDSVTGAHSVPLPEPSGLDERPTGFAARVFAEEEDLELEDSSSIIPVRGLQIAAATFVPTFVLVFFGLPYLLGGATPDRPSSAPPAATSAVAPAARDLSAPPIGSASSAAPAMPSTNETPVESSTLPAVDSTGQAAPSLPPAESSSRPAAQSTPAAPPVPARRAPATPPSAATPESTPPEPAARPEPKKTASVDWTPAAAFADRAAAARLAASIEGQGYPVEIRQDGSSTRPWVVWVGSQPKNGGGRRR